MSDTPNSKKPDSPPEPADKAQPVSIDAGNAASGATAPATPPLSADEQMALYEEDLKESDWGHQPC